MLKNNLTAYLTVSLMFFHLIGIHIVFNAITAFFIIFSFSNRDTTNKIKNLISSSKFWILTLPFFLFATSLVYTNYFNEGWKLLELRLSLLIFPATYGLTQLTKHQKTFVLKAFTFLVVLLPVLGLLINIPTFLSTNDSGYFYNDNIVMIYGKQAAYFGMYINIALIALFYFWYNNVLKNKNERITSYLFLIILLAIQYLLASRTAILISVLSILSYIAIAGITKIGKRKASIIFIGFGVLLSALIILFPKVSKRFESIKHIEYNFENTNQINHFNGEIKKENWNGLNTRLAIWECAWDEIKKAPYIGNGIGSAQPNLISNYEEKKFHFAIKSNYNSHNQYLDVLLSNGIIGLIIFLFFLFYLIFLSIKEKNWLLLSFILIFLISCLTENILNRNQGVIIISLLFSIFLYSSKTNKINL